MRKIWQIALAAVLGLTLVACSGGEASSQSGDATRGAQSQSETVPTAQGEEGSSEETPAPAEGSPEAIIEQIEKDFADTQQGLLDAQTTLFAEVGDTYDGYVANVQAVQDWYSLAVSETEGLSARTLENARQYYRSVVSTVDHGDRDALEDAMDDLYDLIYDDAFEGYYDAIYDEGFEVMYDQYYDGVLADAYDTVPYDEWYDTKSDEYDVWYDGRSDVYDAWYDGRSDIYDEWFDVNSAFYSGDFDINEILRIEE